MGLLSLRRSVAESGLLPVRTALCVLLSSARAWFVLAKLHRRDRVHAVIYGCRHTRAMCGGRFADGGAPPRSRHGQPACWPPRPALSGRRVDPGPWAIAGRPRYVAPRKADRFEVSAAHVKLSVAEPGTQSGQLLAATTGWLSTVLARHAVRGDEGPHECIGARVRRSTGSFSS